MTGHRPTPVDEVPENPIHGLFPLAPKGERPVLVHTVVWLQSYLCLAVRSAHRQSEYMLSTEEGVPILVLQPGL